MTAKNGVLALSGYGIRLGIERGHLYVEDGVGDDRRRTRFSRVNSGIKRIFLLGHSDTVSFEALSWLRRRRRRWRRYRRRRTLRYRRRSLAACASCGIIQRRRSRDSARVNRPEIEATNGRSRLVSEPAFPFARNENRLG